LISSGAVRNFFVFIERLLFIGIYQMNFMRTIKKLQTMLLGLGYYNKLLLEDNAKENYISMEEGIMSLRQEDIVCMLK